MYGKFPRSLGEKLMVLFDSWSL